MTDTMQHVKVAEDIKIDWATHEATRYACTHWHYSKSVPAGKLVKIGAWEKGQFIGVVIFSYGANPNIGTPYGLKQTEVCELTRIAMRSHETPVSYILTRAIKMLKAQSPGVKLIVSYADKDQSHEGMIYRATNWLYEGLKGEGTTGAFIINGKKTHLKTVHSRGWIQSLKWIRHNVDPNAVKFITTGKHKYLFPLDKETRKKIEPLCRPYPKRKKKE